MTIPGVVFLIIIPTENYENIQKLALNEAEKENRIVKSRSQDEVNRNCFGLSDNNQRTMSKSETNINENYITIEEESIDPFNNIEDSQSMAKILREILNKSKISSYSWTSTQSNKFIQVMFSLKTGEFCELLLDQLHVNNIGLIYQSTVAVTPCTLYYSQDADGKRNCGNMNQELNLKNFPNKCDNLGTWKKFLQSVRARLTIGQVVESVKADALLTFDFVFLVVMSTTMCAIGLVESSNLVILSSMLISPMMGPVMAVTFGTVIRDMELKKIGAITEVVGLGIATIVGFLYGSIISLCYDKYGDADWPTAEMISIGQLGTLGVGCLIALISGATIAVGVLSHNVASLVGVAISTSLMPPAVNAGLLWAMTLIYYIKSPANARYATLSFTDFYSDDRIVELTSLGAISMCLTFVNIVCIYASSILVFKIKEVSPMASKDSNRRQFWKQLKLTRNYNLLQNENCNAKFPLCDKLSERQKLRFADLLHHSTDLTHDPERIYIGKSQYTWSPCMYNETRPSIKEIKDFYLKFVTEKNNVKANIISDTNSRDTKNKISTGENETRTKFTVTPCSNNDPIMQL